VRTGGAGGGETTDTHRWTQMGWKWGRGDRRSPGVGCEINRQKWRIGGIIVVNSPYLARTNILIVIDLGYQTDDHRWRTLRARHYVSPACTSW